MTQTTNPTPETTAIDVPDETRIRARLAEVVAEAASLRIMLRAARRWPRRQKSAEPQPTATPEAR